MEEFLVSTISSPCFPGQPKGHAQSRGITFFFLNILIADV